MDVNYEYTSKAILRQHRYNNTETYRHLMSAVSDTYVYFLTKKVGSFKKTIAKWYQR